MTKEREIFSRIASYYDDLVRKHGHSHKSCDYGNPFSQQIKFRVLSEAMPMHHKSILDVGCGMADFSDFLMSKYDGVDYVGIDLSAEMIKEARLLHPDLELSACNILFDEVAATDIVTANGIFYLLGEDGSEIMRKLITRMYELTRIVFAFNSLSSWAPEQEENEFYADPPATVAFCRTLTPWVVLRHDYHPRDFTIYMYKEQNS